ncbi:MAG: hypothetical protein H0X41_05475 [Chitinophagaceae bacterium]|nr:hypothetical protein [Chitinophagaceae bacterium]
MNVTNVNSKVLKIDQDALAGNDQVVSGTKILKRGSPINSIYGLKAIGIFQNADEVSKAPVQFGDYGPGDLKFEDVNGDGQIDDKDRTIIGREDPRWLYGANINVGYHGFDVSTVVSGVSDYQSYGNNEFYEPFMNNSGTGAQWLNRWTPEKPTNFPRLYYGSGPNFSRTNSFWVLDRSFIRLKNVQIGYNLSDLVTKRLKIQRARIYINGQNLLTGTKFIGFDPERIENTTRGGDGYPNLKIVTAGLNITF